MSGTLIQVQQLAMNNGFYAGQRSKKRGHVDRTPTAMAKFSAGTARRKAATPRRIWAAAAMRRPSVLKRTERG